MRLSSYPRIVKIAMVLILAISAVTVVTSVAAPKAGADYINQPGSSGYGGGLISGPNGGSINGCASGQNTPGLLCGGPNPVACIADGYAYGFSLCTYDKWTKQWAGVGNGGSSGMCPTGYDVWHFYGQGVGAAPVVVTAARINIVETPCSTVPVHAVTFSPSPADAGPGPLWDLAGSWLPTFPLISGGGSVGPTTYLTSFGGASFPTYTNGPSNFSWTNNSCASLENPDPAQERTIFHMMADGSLQPSGDPGASASNDAYSWATSYWDGGGSVNHADYLSTAWNTGNDLAKINTLMNLNPATPNLVTASESDRWTALAANFGYGTQACSSPWQFVTNATQANPNPKPSQKTSYGTCIIPIERPSATWFRDTTRYPGQNWNPEFLTSKPDAYYIGNGAQGGYDNWRAAIKTEVWNRPDNGYLVAQHYADPTSLSGGDTRNNQLAAEDASTYAQCIAGATSQAVVPQANPTATQTVRLDVPTLSAGGSLSPQTITMKPRAWLCTALCKSAGGINAAPKSLSFDLKVTSTSGYNQCTSDPATTTGAAAQNCQFYVKQSPAVTQTCDTFFGDLGGGHQGIGIDPTCPAVSAPRTWTVYFYAATQQGQSVTFDVAPGAKGTFVTYDDSFTNVPYTLFGVPVQVPSYKQHVWPYTPTFVNNPQTRPVLDGTATGTQ